MEDLKARTETFLTQVALKARADGLEPDADTKEMFEMVALCYMAGAEEERKYITLWHDPYKVIPVTEGWYLVKVLITVVGEGKELEIPITAYWDGEEWADNHIECYAGEQYSEPMIIGWREIAEPYKEQIVKL